MKREGCSIVFINDKNQVLLFLRDDKPGIPYPNMWDVPGGHVEKDETPEQCIVREMKEEMGLDIKGFQLFSVYDFADRIEHVYWQRANLDINKIRLTEGQCLRWFSVDEAKKTKLACGFNKIIEDFFQKPPF
jgi:8-oxo-dGTP diphosphatase